MHHWREHSRTSELSSACAFLWQVNDAPVSERVDIFPHRLYALNRFEIPELRLLPFGHLHRCHITAAIAIYFRSRTALLYRHRRARTRSSFHALRSLFGPICSIDLAQDREAR
jgi:hypothetical protein